MFSFIIKNNKLYGCGNNDHGQLGMADNINRNVFTEILIDTDFRNVSISPMGNYTIAIDTEGNLWGTGNNEYGQLGLGDKINRNRFTKIICDDTSFIAVSCSRSTATAIDDQGNLWSTNTNTFTKIISDTSFTTVSSYSDHIMAIDIEGNLWGTGNNDYGQLGLDMDCYRYTWKKIPSLSSENFVTVACGGNYTVAINVEGDLYGTGYGGIGALGLFGLGRSDDCGGYTSNTYFKNISFNSDTTYQAVACGTSHTIALDIYGNLWGTGNNDNGPLGLEERNIHYSFTKIPINTYFTAIFCGIYFTMALDIEGNIWSTGYNSRGQLGLGHTTNRNTFTMIPHITADSLCNQSLLIKTRIKGGHTLV